jgi:DNA-directed RNA polymerase subunit omega
MARVTTEDCTEIIPNRFDLVILASQRARAISEGAPLLAERSKNKDPVVALREIAERAVDPAALLEEAIVSQQRYVQRAEPEFDDAFSLEDRHIKSWTLSND